MLQMQRNYGEFCDRYSKITESSEYLENEKMRIFWCGKLLFGKGKLMGGKLIDVSEGEHVN